MDEEVREKFECYKQYVFGDGGLVFFGGMLGIDVSKFLLDEVFFIDLDYLLMKDFMFFQRNCLLVWFKGYDKWMLNILVEYQFIGGSGVFVVGSGVIVVDEME